MKNIIIAAFTSGLLASAAPVNAKPVPTINYSPEQVEVCAPQLKTDAAADAKKSSRGNSVTATATATIKADKGYFIDVRNGSVAFVNTGGTHMNRPGKPSVIKRVNNFLPIAVSITNQAHRGSSLRVGRNAVAVAALSGYQLKATYACMVSIGILTG